MSEMFYKDQENDFWVEHLCFFLILIKDLQTKGPRGNVILYVILIKKCVYEGPSCFFKNIYNLVYDIVSMAR